MNNLIDKFESIPSITTTNLKQKKKKKHYSLIEYYNRLTTHPLVNSSNKEEYLKLLKDKINSCLLKRRKFTQLQNYYDFKLALFYEGLQQMEESQSYYLQTYNYLVMTSSTSSSDFTELLDFVNFRLIKLYLLKKNINALYQLNRHLNTLSNPNDYKRIGWWFYCFGQLLISTGYSNNSNSNSSSSTKVGFTQSVMPSISLNGLNSVPIGKVVNASLNDVFFLISGSTTTPTTTTTTTTPSTNSTSYFYSGVHLPVFYFLLSASIYFYKCSDEELSLSLLCCIEVLTLCYKHLSSTSTSSKKRLLNFVLLFFSLVYYRQQKYQDSIKILKSLELHYSVNPYLLDHLYEMQLKNFREMKDYKEYSKCYYKRMFLSCGGHRSGDGNVGLEGTTSDSTTVELSLAELNNCCDLGVVVKFIQKEDCVQFRIILQQLEQDDDGMESVFEKECKVKLHGVVVVVGRDGSVESTSLCVNCLLEKNESNTTIIKGSLSLVDKDKEVDVSKIVLDGLVLKSRLEGLCDLELKFSGDDSNNDEFVHVVDSKTTSTTTSSLNVELVYGVLVWNQECLIEGQVVNGSGRGSGGEVVELDVGFHQEEEEEGLVGLDRNSVREKSITIKLNKYGNKFAFWVRVDNEKESILIKKLLRIRLSNNTGVDKELQFQNPVVVCFKGIQQDHQLKSLLEKEDKSVCMGLKPLSISNDSNSVESLTRVYYTVHYTLSNLGSSRDLTVKLNDIEYSEAGTSTSSSKAIKVSMVPLNESNLVMTLPAGGNDEKSLVLRFCVEYDRLHLVKSIDLSLGQVTILLQDSKDSVSIHLPTITLNPNTVSIMAQYNDVAHLHKPLHLKYTLRNNSVSRVLKLKIAMDSSESFVVSGLKSSQNGMIMCPQETVMLEYLCVPLQSGFVKLPALKCQADNVVILGAGLNEGHEEHGYSVYVKV